MRSKLSATLIALLGCASIAVAQTDTTFTYQGELKEGGSPANGSFSMEFSLWDAVVGGSQIGSTVSLPGVPVSDGLFGIGLDFGASAFDNSLRWLEVVVDGVPLAPRTPITRAPYAVQTRGVFVDDDGLVGIGTTSPSRKLHVEGQGFPGAFLLLNSTPGGANEDAGINLNRDDAIEWHLFNQGASDSFNLRNAAFQPVLYAEQDRRIGMGTSAPSAESTLHVQDNTGDNFGVLVDSLGAAGSSIGLHVGPSGYSSLAKNASFSPGWFRFDDAQGAFLQEISPDGSVNFFNAPAGADAIAWQTALHIASSGEVAVGHSNPTYQLDVETSGDRGIRGRATGPGGIGLFGSGLIGVSGTSDVAGGAAVSGIGFNNAWAGYFEGDVHVSDRLMIGGETSVTISSYFDVHTPAGPGEYGGMYVDASDAGGWPFYGYATGGVAQAWTYYDGETGAWHLNNTGDRLTVEPNGETGINTTSPAFTLHVNGTAGKPGGGSWSNASDVRLKRDVRTLGGALDQLLRLRGVTFEYTNPEVINELPGERIGMIAQEVEQVFPGWVEVAGHGYKTVTFRGFEALTVEALRELREEKDAQIRSQAARIESLEVENEDLSARLASLEALVAELAAQPRGPESGASTP